MKSKELFPGIFSRHAAAYQRRLDDIMSRDEARGRLRAIELVAARPGMRILDLACGPGNLSRRLATLVAPGGEVVGVDLAVGMIELARNAGIPNARFEVMDIEQLEFPDANFDAALCGHGLQFAPDLGRALREARRVLRVGGTLAASVPDSDVNVAPSPSGSSCQESIWSLLDTVMDRHLPPSPAAVDQGPTRETVLNAPAFRQAALDAGFSSALVEVVSEQVHWDSAEQIVSLLTSWWNCASRLEGIAVEARQAFTEDAITTLKREYPGTIETRGTNNVLVARA